MLKGKAVVKVVDNTFQTPYFQRPLSLGADIVIHSLTKFLSGHNDLIGGAVILKNEEFLEKAQFMRKTLGSPLAPLDSYLTLRGLKTLAVRMDKINQNALSIAHFLENHKSVERVFYPGLMSHPQYEIGLKQMTGSGGIISFELKAGIEAGIELMNSVKLWLLAESLGGCDSLITHPASMTHASVPPEIRQQLGISDGFVRLSVGIEDVEDLIEDLEQALSRIQ
jgi:cystathionine gamma-lyase